MELISTNIKSFFSINYLAILISGGFIVVKENVTSSGEVERDDEDSSVTRPPEVLREIFSLAGLDIIKEFKQNKFPKELYDVHMFALQPKPAT